MYRDTIKDATGICVETICQTILSILLLVLLAGIALGVGLAAIDLIAAISRMSHEVGLHEALKELVVNVLMVLAVLELFRTVKAYFSEGRVKVTYIIDTVLVVVITEIMGFWYREVEVERVALAIALVVALMGVRIMAIRFSPKRRELMDGL
ncbi:MAG: phosphate-starvation-inducible PsiE family protein [Desulfuromonadales bacterium]|nr:phosphate-starvation-inducible PsiE family protein [Desulfuromonadales bacterium]